MRSLHLKMAHFLWKEHLNIGDVAIDATCGNGYDTQALAKLILAKNTGKLYAIDIQEVAIKTTQKRLKESLKDEEFNEVTFHLASHEEFPSDWLKPNLIVYNLGYLPNGDKSITTRSDHTLKSLQNAYNLLNKNGMLSITCYPGHPEGLRESKAILNWLTSLKPKDCIHLIKPFKNAEQPFLILINTG